MKKQFLLYDSRKLKHFKWHEKIDVIFFNFLSDKRLFSFDCLKHIISVLAKAKTQEICTLANIWYKNQYDLMEKKLF